MCSKLKTFKILQIFPNGSVYFDYSAYLKTYKRHYFSKKSFFSNLLNEKKTFLTNSTFFYKKYCNKIIKNLVNEISINCTKYSKFI